jgi:hypothetical protein
VFPNLEKLSLAFAFSDPGNKQNFNIVAHHPKLTVLNLSLYVLYIASYLQHSSHVGINDDLAVRNIVDSCPNLKVLLLAGTDISDRFLYLCSTKRFIGDSIAIL